MCLRVFFQNSPYLRPCLNTWRVPAFWLHFDSLMSKMQSSPNIGPLPQLLESTQATVALTAKTRSELSSLPLDKLGLIRFILILCFLFFYSLFLPDQCALYLMTSLQCRTANFIHSLAPFQGRCAANLSRKLCTSEMWNWYKIQLIFNLCLKICTNKTYNVI